MAFSDIDPDAMVCPECGSEFQPHVLTCIDCGAATVSAASLEGKARPEATPSLGSRFSLPRESEAVRGRFRDVEDAEDFGIFLERHGVPCRLEMTEPLVPSNFRNRRHPRFHVCVAPEDVARSTELEEKYDQIQIRASGTRFQELPPPGWCPVCGIQVGEDAEWCPECGLGIGGTVTKTEDSG